MVNLARGPGNFSSSALVQSLGASRSDLFGREAVSTLISLSQENDPELFCEGLLSVASRLESSERLEAAGLVYQSVQAANVSPSLNGRARRRLDAIQGRDDHWARAGFLAQRLLAQATDPSAIVGMGVAGMVGRVVGLGMLSRLAGSPAGVWTRGLGARVLASTAALALEAPAFTASARGMGVLLGRPQDWSARALWREFASGATTLLGLKVSGAVGGTLVRRHAQGESLLARTGQIAISQSAMIGGIYASHWAEQALGFRDRVDGETTAVDTLGTWIQFNLAGIFGRRILGEGFRRAELSLDRRSEILAQFSRSAPLAASLVTCLTGCSVAGGTSGASAAIAGTIATIGILAAIRGGDRRSRPQSSLPLLKPEVYVLFELSKEPLYVQAIVDRVSEKTNGKVALSLGTICPLLRQLESEGMIQFSHTEPAAGESGGRPRKFYKITEQGHQAAIEIWKTLTQYLIDTEFFGQNRP